VVQLKIKRDDCSNKVVEDCVDDGDQEESHDEFLHSGLLPKGFLSMIVYFN